MTIRSLCASIVLGTFALAGAGCDLFGDETSQVTVLLQNASTASIHILGPGESSDPSNRLDPGAFRSFVYEVPRNDFESNLISGSFRAGSNGAVGAEVTCSTGGDQIGAPTVVYTPSSSLICESWEL